MSDGPGTPAHRFSRILDELEKRFPDAAPALLSDPPEPKYLAAIDAMQAELKQAWAQVEVLKQPLVRTDNTEYIANLEAENRRLRGLLEECKPILMDLAINETVVAGSKSEGSELQKWYLKNADGYRDLLERMER